MNWDILEGRVGPLLIWGTIGAIGIAVAAHFIRKTREEPVQHEPTSSELISKFRDLHAKGELSDEEFRKIKTKLGAQLQEELNENDETG